MPFDCHVTALPARLSSLGVVDRYMPYNKRYQGWPEVAVCYAECEIPNSLGGELSTGEKGLTWLLHSAVALIGKKVAMFICSCRRTGSKVEENKK